MSKHTGLLFIGFVIVAAIAVIIFVNRNASTDVTNTNTNSDSDTTVNSNATIRSNDNTETVSADGAYTLLQAAETTINGEITTYRFTDGNSLSVMPEALQSVVLNETPVKEEVDITVGGLPATRYTLASAKDGSLFTVVQIIYESKLYDFRGSTDYLDDLSQYIKFTNNE
jgi:hypothetical protein